MTFNLRDKSEVEYQKYIEQIQKALNGYRAERITENIQFHLSKGKPSNIYKLKVCVPTQVYVAGLPHYDFIFRQIYFYKTFVHFIVEMHYVEGETLGQIPQPNVLIDILNKPVLEFDGRLLREKSPIIPSITPI